LIPELLFREKPNGFISGALGFATLSTNLQEHGDAASFVVCRWVDPGTLFREKPNRVSSDALGFAALSANLQEHGDAASLVVS
jgi:hypothetical protein